MSESDSDSDIEEENRRLYPVSQVIQPLGAADYDYNLWPCFLLEDAIVLDKRGNSANLLDVSTLGPFTIKGRMQIDVEDEPFARLRSPKLKSAHIVVEDVVQFSFGTRENSADTGHVCMWGGSTKYGWFEINPSKAYGRTYATSVEAVNIYYFMQSLYQQKGAMSLSIGDVLYRYAIGDGAGRNRVEVEGTMKRHASFLLAEMNKKEEVNFPRTVLYNWLAKSSPDVVAKLREQKVHVNVTHQAIGPTSIQIAPPPPVEDKEENPEPFERPAGELDQDNENEDMYDRELLDDELQEFDAPEPSSSDIPAYIAWFLEWARHYGPPKYDTAFQKLELFTAKKASTIVYTECRIKAYFTAGELLRHHRVAIAEEIAKYPIWLSTPMYEELKGSEPFSCPRRAPEFVAAAQQMTSICLRNPMAHPRRTRSDKADQSKSSKKQRSTSPGGTSYQSHHFAPRFNPTSRSDSPTLPISSKRLQTTKPVVVLPAFTGSREDIRRREAANNLAKSSGEGIPVQPRGKTPARKPINISLANTDEDANMSPSRPLKRSRTEEGGGILIANQSHTNMPSSDDDDEEESEEDEDEPIHLTIVSLPQHTMDEAGYGLAQNILEKETVLTGHNAPFLQQLIAEGKERLKERETIGTKVVPHAIRGFLRQ